MARDGVVSLDTIEQALQRQVLEGGELDTALLELGAVSENVLGAYRAAAFQMPAAPRAQLEHGDPALYSRVPSNLARELRVVPVVILGDMLVLATDVPLALTDAQRLSRSLDTRVAFRIATEVRVQAALSQHYGAEMPSRLRLLAERLRVVDAGSLCEVQPWTKAQSVPPSTRTSRTSTGPLGSPPAPVRVMRVVSLGERRSSTGPEAFDTRPLRPSRLLQSRRTRRTSSIPRGPITRLAVIELLVKARDRDRVLDVFFAFARQYFECTVLFALRDERLLGIEASGLPPPVDANALEAPVAPGGAVQALIQTRKPQVLDLRTSAADHSLVEALGRQQGQPCAIIPVAIRQRNVALLYGDRSGDRLALTDVAELIQTLPSVSAAFERLIQERKMHALEARRAPAPEQEGEEPTPPRGTFRPSDVPPAPAPTAPEPEAALGVPRGYVPKQRTAPGVASRREEAQEATPVADQRPLVHGDAPAPPRVPADAQPPAFDDSLVDSPTVKLPLDEIERALRPNASQSSTSYSARGAPMDDVRARRREQELTRPDRPSKLTPPRDKAASPRPRRRSDPPSPRTLSQPPPGTGSYTVRHTEPEQFTRLRTQTPEPAQERWRAPADALQARETASRSPAIEAPMPDASQRATLRSDPRRDKDADAAPNAEVVAIPSTVRESLRPARMTPQDTKRTAGAEPSAEAERLVSELCRVGPDEEQPALTALLRLGDAALPVLSRRFPGPLWFDRHKPRQRMPQGRDVSAIARTLFAFEARAIPFIAQLLQATQPEVRLCATLLAADCVNPDLLVPLSNRLFDPDGQVRLIAIESLPAYRNTRGFDEVRRSLRETAKNAREPIPSRLSALEAISVLRDGGSVPILIELCAHQSRQLSVPAHRSLLAITAQDFGDSERKWKNWYDKHKAEHRAQWLIEGLMHGEERVRTSAGLELQKLSQTYYGYSASAPRRDRDRVQRRYQQWWETQGKKLRL